MKFTKMVAASLLAFASIPAAAQSDVGLAVGATVYGSDAGEVGKIVEVGDGYVIVDTGTHKATLPNSSFGKGSKGPLIGLTKAGLDEFVAKANAEAAAKLAEVLKPQATIQGAAGGDLGTVKSIEADGTVVVTYKGIDTAFPKDQFYANDAGQLALPFTAEQLDQALAPQFEAAGEAKAALEAALTAGRSFGRSDHPAQEPLYRRCRRQPGPADRQGSAGRRHRRLKFPLTATGRAGCEQSHPALFVTLDRMEAETVQHHQLSRQLLRPSP